MTTAKEAAKAEVLRRIGYYKRAPTLGALYRRLARKVGDEDAVDEVVRELVKDNRLRVTNRVFYIPIPWGEFFWETK